MAKDSEYKRTTSDTEGSETPDVHHISNPDVLHEKNDVNVFAIIRFIGGLAVATFAVLGLMLALLKVLEGIEARKDDPTSPLARSEQERLPPNPRLQAAKGHGFTPEDITDDPALRQRLTKEELNFELEEPMEEWDVLRKYKLEELHSYGKDMRQPSEFRIPVDRAKELLLERNLLASRQQQQQQSGVNDGGGGQGTAMPANEGNEIKRMEQAEGYEALPTYQSSGQKAERRRQ